MEQYISLVFVFNPIIRFLCNPVRKWNKKWKHTGRVLVYLLLVSSIVFKLTKKDKNCFQLLNVTPFSSFDVIRKSFKTVAFNLHPDRNPSKTAMSEYSTLTEKYKYISSPENHYKYTRFFDLVKREERAFHEMSILDLLTLSILKSFTTIMSTFFILFTNGEKISGHPLLLYAVFMMFFDLYLRLSEELFFTTKIPFLKYYVTFEILMLFNEFKVFFIHYSTLFPDDRTLSVSVGANVLANNLKVVDSLEKLSNRIERTFVLGNFSPKYEPDEQMKALNDDLKESDKMIEKLCNKSYNLDWSKESRKKFDELSKYGDKISSEGRSLLSFIIISAIILLNFLR